MAEQEIQTLLKDAELNDDLKEDLEAFFHSTIIGKRVDFIDKQRENPIPSESTTHAFNELSEEQILEVIQETNKHIWGS